MHFENNWAVIVPMANEEKDFTLFTSELAKVLDQLNSGIVYLIIDNASNDTTYELSTSLSSQDSRFKTIWAPENRNVVDAYLRGYKEAYENNHVFIIEMDAGMSHDPKSLHLFLKYLNDGYECVFGSRFIKGGSINQSSFFRRCLSRSGIVTNFFLGTNLLDMTSGYQGFQRHVVASFLHYPFLSKAHFYQTELKYLLRNGKNKEVPIHYRSPSNRISFQAITNSIYCLLYYTLKRWQRDEKGL